MLEFTSGSELMKHYAAVRARLNPRPPPARLRAPVAAAPPKPLPVDPTPPAQIVRRLNPVRTIIHAAAQHAGLQPLQIVSHRHRAPLVRARHIAMFLAYDMTSMSFPAIGSQFDDRDHTTILHAVKKIERLIPTDCKLAADVEAVRALAIAADPTLGPEAA
jgi:hypothetical protein